MSTKQLAQKGVAPFSLTNEGYPVYKFGGLNTIEEAKFSSSLTKTTPSGSTAIIECRVANSDKNSLIIDDFLDFKVDNTNTNSAIWKSPYHRFSSIRMLWDNEEVDYVRNLDEIVLRYNKWWLEHCGNQDDIDKQFPYLRRLETNSLVGDTDTTATNNMLCSIPLFVLFPYMKNMSNGFVNVITYEIRFADNTSTIVGNTAFVQSSDTSNAYNDLITYKDIKIRRVFNRLQTGALLEKPMLKNLVTKHEIKRESVRFDSVGANVAVFKFSDFAWHQTVKKCCLWVDAPADRTTYNDADASKLYSGPRYIGWKIVKDGKDLLDYSLPVEHLKARRDYQQQILENEHDNKAILKVINNTDDFAKLHLGTQLSMVDFTNINVFEQHEAVLNGPSRDENIELWVYVGEALSAGNNVNLNCAMEYVEEIVKTDRGFVKNIRP